MMSFDVRDTVILLGLIAHVIINVRNHLKFFLALLQLVDRSSKMGSKAIIRGRNCIIWRLSCQKNRTSVTINLNILGNNGMSDDVHSGKSASDHKTYKGAGLESLAKHQLLHGLVDGGSPKGRHKLILPLRSSAMWQTLRFASTNAARRPEFDSGNDQDRQQENDVSIEDSVDSAVELRPAKAKPEMKNQEQSSTKQKFWTSVRGIGPAMKGVGSMSR